MKALKSTDSHFIYMVHIYYYAMYTHEIHSLLLLLSACENIGEKNSYRISIPHGLISVGTGEANAGLVVFMLFEIWPQYVCVRCAVHTLCCVRLDVRHILCMCTIIIIIDISSVWLYLLLWHIVFIDFLFSFVACLLCLLALCLFVWVCVFVSSPIVRIHDDADDDIVYWWRWKQHFHAHKFCNLNIWAPFSVNRMTHTHTRTSLTWGIDFYEDDNIEYNTELLILQPLPYSDAYIKIGFAHKIVWNHCNTLEWVSVLFWIRNVEIFG